MENNTQIQLSIQEQKDKLIFLEERLRRVVSDAESEKYTRGRMNQVIFGQIKDVADEFKDIIYGKDRKSGLIVDLDRLNQESIERKKHRQHILALWVSVGLMLLKEVIDFFKKA